MEGTCCTLLSGVTRPIHSRVRWMNISSWFVSSMHFDTIRLVRGNKRPYSTTGAWMAVESIREHLDDSLVSV